MVLPLPIAHKYLRKYEGTGGDGGVKDRNRSAADCWRSRIDSRPQVFDRIRQFCVQPFVSMFRFDLSDILSVSIMMSIGPLPGTLWCPSPPPLSCGYATGDTLLTGDHAVTAGCVSTGKYIKRR
eukprot:SAG11_NODE_458_length_9290_cov_2.641388_13_plen_124_part_00